MEGIKGMEEWNGIKGILKNRNFESPIVPENVGLLKSFKCMLQTMYIFSCPKHCFSYGRHYA